MKGAHKLNYAQDILSNKGRRIVVVKQTRVWNVHFKIFKRLIYLLFEQRNAMTSKKNLLIRRRPSLSMRNSLSGELSLPSPPTDQPWMRRR